MCKQEASKWWLEMKWSKALYSPGLADDLNKDAGRRGQV